MLWEEDGTASMAYIRISDDYNHHTIENRCNASSPCSITIMDHKGAPSTYNGNSLQGHAAPNTLEGVTCRGCCAESAECSESPAHSWRTSKDRKLFSEDLCYLSNWTETNTKEETVVQPATKFPPLHPKVLSSDYCGQVDTSLGIPSEATVPWNSSDGSCVLKTGQEVFYAQLNSKSNFGYVVDKAITFFFLKNTVDEIYMGQVNGGNWAGGGAAYMNETFTISPASATVNFNYLLRDDGGPHCSGTGCSNYCTASGSFTGTGDCWGIDQDTGQGSIRFKWAKKYTDGFIMASLLYIALLVAGFA
ncbi:hypothetical protein CYMTET_21349 [Cymbomonas tetramitiformis]|uniref:Uncharacterized protein n=1 Tax=Cymbomonas tetramitiformis TaxID=36881 RepID=A0AAE0L3B0_9CHLO|nr:hypothetical protein CYMTET_21349 [Cymbomonas tetramitiformis]